MIGTLSLNFKNEKELLKIIETDYKTTNILPGDNMFLGLKSPYDIYIGKFNIGIELFCGSQIKRSGSMEIGL